MDNAPGKRVIVIGAGIVGASLAAIVGRLASEEIVGDKACSALNPCRPDRFFQA